MFLRPDGTQTELVFDGSGAADRQTLRAVRELSPSSATVLDALIEPASAPAPSAVMTVSLRRGPCNGQCPVYEVEFWRDGFASWKGGQHVDRAGLFDGEVSSADFRAIARQIVASGFYDWEESSVPSATCLSDYELVARTALSEKRVLRWAMAEPPEFQALAKAIDDVAEQVEWTRFELEDIPR